MGGDLVIGIDSSTTATKAIAWTAAGKAAGGRPRADRAREPQAELLRAEPRGLVDVDPHGAEAAHRQDRSRPHRRDCDSNQRETFAPLDADGKAVRPGMIWLDERARPFVDEVAELVGGTRDGLPEIHRISGKPVDVIPVANRVYWMRKTEPKLHARTAMFCDVHGYIVRHLTGTYATSWASADPLGIFDNERKCWSETIMDAIGIDASRLPDAKAPGTVLGTVTAEAAEQTGLRAGTPGGRRRRRRPARRPRHRRAVAGSRLSQCRHRPRLRHLRQGLPQLARLADHGQPDRREGYYYEACVRAGTFTVTWFVNTVCKGETMSDALFATLEQEAADVPIGSTGLLMIPYWQGVMSPYWNSSARGAFIGLSGAHGRGHMYRALMEGLALEQRLSTADAERELGQTVERFVGIGGGAASDIWRQIFADATGKIVERSETVEASSLGAAMCAAVAAGWFSSFDDASKAMQGRIVARSEPIPENHERYLELFEVYKPVYERLVPVYSDIDRFIGGAS
ncbi:MAG: xylulose kinase [Brucellaceae bacterium]|nr:xylulose kinase [Brucellaceae bacterium]